MRDRDIDEFLADEGFGQAESLAVAREILHEAALSRPGKQRIAESKLENARCALRSRLIVSCAKRSCVEAAGREGRRPVPAYSRAGCEVCGGSDNAHAVDTMVPVATGGGVRRIVVVGGSPSTHAELAMCVAGRLQLRLIDGTERRTARQARDDLVWADLVIVWGSTPLAHQVSLLYTRRPGVHPPVITVARRGVAALAGELLRHFQGSR